MKEQLSSGSAVMWRVAFILVCAAAAVFILRRWGPRWSLRSDHCKNAKSWYALAFRDSLTGLLNRNAYAQKIRRLEKRRPERMWLLLFDIDNLKGINDTKGHLFGDEMLIAAAERLEKIFAARCHSIYRIGGDEFVVISENMEEEQILDLLRQLRDCEAEKREFRFSKGFAKVAPGQADAFRTAFGEADRMLYAEKNMARSASK